MEPEPSPPAEDIVFVHDDDILSPHVTPASGFRSVSDVDGVTLSFDSLCFLNMPTVKFHPVMHLISRVNSKALKEVFYFPLGSRPKLDDVSEVVLFGEGFGRVLLWCAPNANAAQETPSSRSGIHLFQCLLRRALLNLDPCARTAKMNPLQSNLQGGPTKWNSVTIFNEDLPDINQHVMNGIHQDEKAHCYSYALVMNMVGMKEADRTACFHHVEGFLRDWHALRTIHIHVGSESEAQDHVLLFNFRRSSVIPRPAVCYEPLGMCRQLSQCCTLAAANAKGLDSIMQLTVPRERRNRERLLRLTTMSHFMVYYTTIHKIGSSMKPFDQLRIFPAIVLKGARRTASAEAKEMYRNAKHYLLILKELLTSIQSRGYALRFEGVITHIIGNADKDHNCQGDSPHCPIRKRLHQSMTQFEFSGAFLQKMVGDGCIKMLPKTEFGNWIEDTLGLMVNTLDCILEDGDHEISHGVLRLAFATETAMCQFLSGSMGKISTRAFSWIAARHPQYPTYIYRLRQLQVSAQIHSFGLPFLSLLFFFFLKKQLITLSHCPLPFPQCLETMLMK